MEYDIGSKIQAARLEKNMTQEQVAGLLEVSRQTISNWENAKSYPDIVSVIKMSECYDVSLDYLLKGEQKMNTYYDYLEESTNVVKSNTKRNKNKYATEVEGMLTGITVEKYGEVMKKEGFEDGKAAGIAQGEASGRAV